MGPLETAIFHQRALSSLQQAHKKVESSELLAEEQLKFQHAQALIELAIATSLSAKEAPLYVASAVGKAAEAVAKVTLKGESPFKNSDGVPLEGEKLAIAARSHVQNAVSMAQGQTAAQTIRTNSKPAARY